MPDAQRHDKLPLMNGPTAHLLALHNEDKEGKIENGRRRGRKKRRSPVVRARPWPFLQISSKSFCDFYRHPLPLQFTVPRVFKLQKYRS